MATGPPPTTNGPANPDAAQTPTQTTSSNWEGDRMFNIYIIDYCQKRGFTKTAQQLAEEAGIPLDSQPPINAKQGLLFEWWSVFWVLFTAKNSGTGSADALTYTEHQAHMRAAQKPGQQAIVAAAVRQLTNGALPRAAGSASILANGAPAGGLQPGQHPMLNGATVQMYSGPPHVNGAALQTNGPTIGTPAVPNMPRPAPIQQRAMNAPYQRSPTMAPSPQTQGTPTQGPQQPGPGPQGQMRTMMPPNGPRPGNSMPGAHQQTPQPAFQQLGATASHPNSPAQGTNTGSSPSFATRQPANMVLADVNQEFWYIESSKLTELKGMIGISHKDMPSLTPEEKQKMLQTAKQHGWMKNNQGAPSAAAGPSNVAAQRPPQQLHTPQTQPRTVKRSSTSPGDEGDQAPNNDSSPPANKRLRRSPTGAEPPPPMAPMVPSYPQQQQQINTPGAQHHGIPNGVMNRPMPGNMPMTGFPVGGMPPHMTGNPPMMQMSSQAQAGGPHAMSPAMVNQSQPYVMAQYRQNMQALHKPGAMPNLMSGNQASPGGPDPQFNNNDASGMRPGTGQFAPPPGMQGQVPPGMQGQMPPNGMPGQRGPVQNKPAGMMPPPSPAMKNNVTQNKDGSGDSTTNSSPRNAAANTGPGPRPGPPGQQPNAPGNAPHMGMNTAPPTPGPAGPSNMSTPTPASVLNNGNQPQSAAGQGDQLGGDTMFNGDFLSGLGGMDFQTDSLSSFDFDRDFGNLVNLDGTTDMSWITQ